MTLAEWGVVLSLVMSVAALGLSAGTLVRDARREEKRALGVAYDVICGVQTVASNLYQYADLWLSLPPEHRTKITLPDGPSQMQWAQLRILVDDYPDLRPYLDAINEAGAALPRLCKMSMSAEDRHRGYRVFSAKLLEACDESQKAIIKLRKAGLRQLVA